MYRRTYVRYSAILYSFNLLIFSITLITVPVNIKGAMKLVRAKIILSDHSIRTCTDSSSFHRIKGKLLGIFWPWRNNKRVTRGVLYGNVSAVCSPFLALFSAFISPVQWLICTIPNFLSSKGSCSSKWPENSLQFPSPVGSSYVPYGFLPGLLPHHSMCEAWSHLNN